MHSYNDRFEDLRQEIEIWEQAATDPNTIEAAREQRDDAMSKMVELEDDAAYRRYVVQYLTQEADSDRRDCCTCADPFCAIKRGVIPAEIDLADDIDEGITEFAANHAGEPRALLEARDERVKEAEQVERQLMRSITTLKRDEGEPFVPDSEDDEDDTDGEAESASMEASA